MNSCKTENPQSMSSANVNLLDDGTNEAKLPTTHVYMRVTVRVIISVKIAKPYDAHRPLHQNNTPPYSPTNIALYFINRGLFYSSILAL